MPNRYIREGINSSDKVDALFLRSPAAESFYKRLILVVDDYGRIEANPTFLRSKCFPKIAEKVPIHDVEDWVDAASQEGLVQLYEVKGKIHLTLFNVGEPRAKHSKWPAPNEGRVVLSLRANVRVCVQMSPITIPSSVPSPSASSVPSTKTPTLAPLSKAEWAQPDIHEVAARLARELSALHWCSSEIPQAEAAMIRELVRAVDVLAWETATRISHVLWREAVAAASLDGSLPNSITNKRLAYWIADGLYAQKPKFGLRAYGKPEAPSPYSKVIPDWVKD